MSKKEMGQYWIDQYSLLHFASGIVAYFWGIPFVWTFILHTAFEFTENTKIGMDFINHYIPFWPGGKPPADSIPNQISDTLMTVLGWWISRVADSFSKEHHLYPGNIV